MVIVLTYLSLFLQKYSFVCFPLLFLLKLSKIKCFKKKKLIILKLLYSLCICVLYFIKYICVYFCGSLLSLLAVHKLCPFKNVECLHVFHKMAKQKKVTLYLTDLGRIRKICQKFNILNLITPITLICVVCIVPNLQQSAHFCLQLVCWYSVCLLAGTDGCFSMWQSALPPAPADTLSRANKNGDVVYVCAYVHLEKG